MKPPRIDHYREYPLLPRKKILSVLILILEALESDESEDEQDVSGVNTTYDHPDHVVTVTTISDVNLDSGKFACIGPNKVSNSWFSFGTHHLHSSLYFWNMQWTISYYL